ncbi:Oxidoreductase [Klebsiella pneumoniae]|uniref:Oxidoreductase n=1 Tax=Klebsiella pneumoniae TaxID=573 RepID=A0A377ZWB7_KLEPN|nr:Oxidoreductase [Klebsiella pneumoniae]
MINGLKPLDRTLRWGMVGGGGSQIGYIHRSAALRDNTFTLLAGAFDIDAERGRQFGQQLGWIPTAVTPTIKACSAARLPGLTAFRRCQLPRQITPTMPSAGPRWRPGCTWCAKSRCASAARKLTSWWRSASGGARLSG